ncbi:uncharacterized protein LOC120296188 [Eucalyptus grandis]|uniref:uncharacterized protein LOC120296188 n=1 Tax=Eucalyptus grandis TaxID=71139 RepID=UPI00192EE566|nr:uncharacterized protein LOC120296188 [Eucalyptus grandis]
MVRLSKSRLRAELGGGTAMRRPAGQLPVLGLRKTGGRRMWLQAGRSAPACLTPSSYPFHHLHPWLCCERRNADGVRANPSCSSPLLAEVGDLCGPRSSSTAATRRASAPSRRFAPVVRCSSRGNACIPKLEPFSRTRLERGLREPPLIQKCENELADYCSTLEGDSSYSYWRAYFEPKDLEVSLQISSPPPPPPKMPF